MKKNVTHSIKFKLIIAIALLHSVLMAVFVWDLVDRQQTFLIDESKHATIGMAKTLATNSVPWVLSNDLSGLEEIIESQSQQPNIDFAMVTDTYGKILAYYHKSQHNNDDIVGKKIATAPLVRALERQTIAQFSDDHQQIDIATPIKVQDTVIGWARIGRNRSHITESMRIISIEGLLYALFAIVIGTFFAWRMGHNLTNGINSLIDTTQQVRSGKRNIAISLNRKDELQILSNNFQSMLDDLNAKEQELFQDKELLEVTLKSIGDGVITTDKNGLITYLNPVAEEITGWSNHSAQGTHIDKTFKIYNENTMEPVKNPAILSMESKATVAISNNTILINHAEEHISIEESGAPIIDNNDQIVGAILVFHDATEARQLKKRLTWQAMHDSLTGLDNRQSFEIQLDELIERSELQPQQIHCLIYIDLDQFKIVNDTVGHSAGDELLKQVATILQQHVRETDLLARIGGDEFGVLLENCPVEVALRIAEKIRVAVYEYKFLWEDRIFDIGTSIGITYMQGMTNKANVMSQADVACYLSKENGRNCIHVFQENNQVLNNKISSLDWANRIKRAIESKQFVLFAQKIVPLQAQITQHSYEILVRMQTSEGEIITPDQFLPAAERFNLMADLDIFIVKQAYEWVTNNFDRIDLININISGQSLDNENFNNALIDILESNPKINRKICFEITETTAITHMSASIKFLNRIKSNGCLLALDDFGSGFSSFGWLKTLPVDYVKIDGAFILDVLSDRVDAAMVKAIHQISVEMNISTIAEFVENQEVVDWLTQTGIDFAQGYHFDKPKSIINIL